MKTAICTLVALFVGVGVGYFGKKQPAEVEKVVEKEIDRVIEGVVPLKITAVDNVKDSRFDKEPKNSVSAVITFNREVPNGYGLLVVDLKDGGQAKFKITDNHGPGFKWGGPVTKLNSQWTPRSNTEPGHLVGCNARFYSSDFPPEVLRNNIK